MTEQACALSPIRGVLQEQMPEFKQVQRQLERLTQQYQQEAMERQSKQLKLKEDFRRQELLQRNQKG